MTAGPLGRRLPTDFVHVDRWPLQALPLAEQPTSVPMALGVNWYTNFDNPIRDSKGRYWIGRGPLGTIRGGHCVCIRAAAQKDATAWWTYYDQGREGACVGFGCSRMMSLLNRRRYDARWLWNEAKRVDEWPETVPGDDNGTSVRAGCDVLRKQGHRRVWGPITFPVIQREGIAANRWATSWDEVRRVVGAVGDGVPILNSWGQSYPHVVWLTDETGARLLQEYGEAAVVTDL